MSDLPGQIGSLEAYDDALRILSRMNIHGVLPEVVREGAVGRNGAWHRSGTHAGLRKSLLLIYFEKRKAQLFAELADILFSNVDEIIQEVREGWDGEDDPDDAFSMIRESLRHFQGEGSEDEVAGAEDFLERIRDVVHEMVLGTAGSAGSRRVGG